MLLVCPNCRSGLEVPDDTDALVRCPSCRTVFDPSIAQAPPAPARRPRPADDDEDNDRPRSRRPRRPESDDDRPRRNRRDDDDDYEDDEDEAPRPRRRAGPVSDETPKAREKRKRAGAALRRAEMGAKLVKVGFIAYIASLMAVMSFGLITMVLKTGPVAALGVAAGLAAVNWLATPVGLGLLLSGTRPRGTIMYGVGALVVVVVHLGLMLGAVGRAGDEEQVQRMVKLHERAAMISGKQVEDVDTIKSALQLANVPTRFQAVCVYPLAVAYSTLTREAGLDPVYIAAGVVEMLRLILVLLTLGCAVRDVSKDAEHACFWAAGIITFVPGGLIALNTAVVVFVIETGMVMTGMGRTILGMTDVLTMNLLAGMLIKPFRAAGDAAEAFEDAADDYRRPAS